MKKLSAWKMAGAVFVCAAVVSAAPAQRFNSFSFSGTDGANPQLGSLVQGRDANFYGTTSGDGAHGNGTVFRVTQGSKLTTLYSFCSQPECSDGVSPYAGLILADDGSFYGTTLHGGTNGAGTIFKITPSATLTTLYNFCAQAGCIDGEYPYAGLVQARDGDFYGATWWGGANSDGTIFKITQGGTLTTLHAFGGYYDGAHPYTAPIQAADGNFYGTTADGGGYNSGTIFMMTDAGALTTLYDLVDPQNSPYDGLVQATNGNFDGTTYGAGHGTIFEITADGELTTLHLFDSTGGNPWAGLVLATDGNFYGTTLFGGNPTCTPDGCGTVFRFSSGGALTTLHSFDSADGGNPYGGLLQATNGNFYGMTYAGGSDNLGTLFSLDIGLGPFVAFVRSAGKVGQTGGILGQGFTRTTGVSLNGIPASFTVVSDTYIRATVPVGGTTGYVTVTTTRGVLTSNVPFHVIP